MPTRGVNTHESLTYEIHRSACPTLRPTPTLPSRAGFRALDSALSRGAATPGRRCVPAVALVVFVNSTAGLGAGAGSAAYAASKHALRAVADGLRAEVNADGVRVLSVYPGRTRGRMQREVCRGLGQRYDAERFLDPADVATAIVDAAALPPSAEVYDLRLRPASKPRL